MENINYSLNELEQNNNNNNQAVDLTIFFGYNDICDVEQLKLYYNMYTIKNLQQIIQYYGLQKNKMVKEELIQVLLFFEMEPENKSIVERRLRLWQNIQELKNDPYFSKFILF
jgi:hypothetical protein